jgi:hypothetical protein
MVTSVSSSIRPDKIISLQDAHFSDGDPAVGSADGHGSMSAGWTVNIATLAGCRVDPLDDAIAKAAGILLGKWHCHIRITGLVNR